MSATDPNSESGFKTCVIRSDRAEIPIPKEAVLRELEAYEYGEDAQFAVKLALEEALANAVKHGCRGDCSKMVTVRYAVDADRVAILVRDEGAGFVPDEVPDPTHPERIALPSGRGIMLIRAYMDEVEFRDEGREVYFVRYRRRKRGTGKRRPRPTG